MIDFLLETIYLDTNLKPNTLVLALSSIINNKICKKKSKNIYKGF